MTLTYPIKILENKLSEIKKEYFRATRIAADMSNSKTIQNEIQDSNFKDKMIKIESAIKILNEFNFEE